MINENLMWRRMKNNSKDIHITENMLRDLEDDYVCACARFSARGTSSAFSVKDPIWKLTDKNETLKALIINSRSTILPVFCNLKEIPSPKFLSGFFSLIKIHSVQGLKEEVIIMEKAMKQYGKNITDIFDYDLMSLEARNANFRLEERRAEIKEISGLVLRVPRMTDLDALAPLQAAYEHEEVLHKGSVFSPAASRVNLSNIIADRLILAAEINGRLIGKINVSGVSFTKYLIGGIYVHPDFRSMGVARFMTSQFITSLTKEDRGVSLFVKKTNIPALKLYSGLGFKARTDYRITYFDN